MKHVGDIAVDMNHASRALGVAAGKVALLGQQRGRARVSGRVLNRRSGDLLATILGTVQPDASGPLILFQAGGGPRRVRYARIHELGGVIVPVNKPWLVFKVGGHWVRTKRVVMPRRPYLKPSRDEAAQALPSILTHELRLALRRGAA